MKVLENTIDLITRTLVSRQGDAPNVPLASFEFSDNLVSAHFSETLVKIAVALEC